MTMRVVIADDSRPYRTMLHKLLDTIPGISVVAEAASRVDAVQAVREMGPDLLILDLRLPNGNGWDVLREIQAMGNCVRVLIHSGHVDEYYRAQALQRGAAAFVPKGNVQLLIEALENLVRETKSVTFQPMTVARGLRYAPIETRLQ